MLQKSEGEIKNWQFKKICKSGHTRHPTKTNKKCNTHIVMDTTVLMSKIVIWTFMPFFRRVSTNKWKRWYIYINMWKSLVYRRVIIALWTVMTLHRVVAIDKLALIPLFIRIHSDIFVFMFKGLNIDIFALKPHCKGVNFGI